MISPNTQVKASNDQVSCELDQETAILDMKTGIYYGLDPVGARVWELIQQPATVASVVAQLLDEYDADPEQVTGDVIMLLTQMHERQLIEIQDEGG